MVNGAFMSASRSMFLLVVVCLPIIALAQATPPQPASNAAAKVAAIMDEILTRNEGHVGDVKTCTWWPPSQEDIKRIREIGHDAIAPLSNALNSTRCFQKTLTVRLLGELGGADVVPPLKRALQPDEPNSVRIAALGALLLSVPDDLALPIILNAVHDSDPVVAEFARNFLADYYHRGTSGQPH